MYLPERITKVLSKINDPYVVHYEGDRISLIEAEDKKVKIYSTNSGCCIEIQGFTINIRDLESLEKLLIKFNVISKQKSKTKSAKIKEDISEMFSDTKKEVAVQYHNGRVLSVFIQEPKVVVNKTEFGYKIKMGSTKEIAVESINSLRVLLEKMNIIPIKKKKEKRKTVNKDSENIGFEQLTLGI